MKVNRVWYSLVIDCLKLKSTNDNPRSCMPCSGLFVIDIFVKSMAVTFDCVLTRVKLLQMTLFSKFYVEYDKVIYI